MTDERKKQKQTQKQWVIDLYNQGMTLKNITGATGVTSPTIYRYLREQESGIRNTRKGKLVNDTGEPRKNRSEAMKRYWAGKTTGVKKELIANGEAHPVTGKPWTMTQVLNQINMTLGQDDLGQYLYREDTSCKVYLTEAEVKSLIKKPFSTIKVLAIRINAALNSGKEA